MLLKKTLKKTILASLLIAATVLAQTPYDDGQRALREQNWTQAADHFEDAIKADKKQADAAMYWRAHALYKAGRNNEAERQVRSLGRKYPDSRWVKEAQLLQIEHDGSEPVLAGATDGVVLDDDLRMFALAQLMERDPERALPLVMEMIQDTDSEKVSGDMLFLLGMSEEPRAQQFIAQIARDSNNPDLQADAIHMLGIASSQASIELLAELYRDTDNDKVKRAVIEAYIIADESDKLLTLLLDLLKSEQDPELQNEMIHALGVMDATDALKDIYPSLKRKETRVAALEAFSISGSDEILREVLDTETDPELRKAAIHGIAMEDGTDAAALLESVYDNATSIEEKTMVLEALVMMDDAENLALKVVRTETDQDLRRTAIHILGVMEATSEIAELYATIEEKELRKAVRESMMVADDTDGLIKVLQSEQDPEMRAAAIHLLAVSDDEDGAEYLLSLYPQGSREEKQAVIHSMMIMDNTRGLISLLKTETDPDLKREMLQVLTHMDSEESEAYLFELLEQKG